MFSKVISNTPFIDYSMNWHVHGDSYGDDVTFESTLRALLENRVGEDVVHHSFYSDDGTPNVERITRSFQRGADNYMVVRTFSSIYDLDDMAPQVSGAISSFKSDEYWTYVPKITEFYKKAFPVFCFVNAEHKHVLFVTGHLDYKRMHFLQCAIPISMPWYFAEKPLTESEVTLIRSLSSNDAGAYEEALGNIAKEFDIRTRKIKSMLQGFESLEERNRLENLNNELMTCRHNLEEYNNMIGDLIRRMHSFEDQIFALNTKIRSGGEGDNVIMRYFLTHDNVDLAQVDGSELTFAIRSELINWNEDVAKKSINNPRSDIYHPRYKRIGLSDYAMKRLWTSIFVDQEIGIEFCAAFRLNLHDRARPLSSGHGAFSTNRMPNPHTVQYGCMGNYTALINESILARNYLAAIEYCVNASGSLNFNDPTVMSYFINTMWGEGCQERFLRLPNGEPCNQIEAVNWLKANKEWEESDA